jgi:hypothetical protein
VLTAERRTLSPSGVPTSNTVSLPSEIVQPGTSAEAAVGGVSLVLGGLIASAVVPTAAKSAPAIFYLACGMAVLWGLAGVVVAQYDRSLLTTGAATLSAIVLALVLLAALRVAGARSRARRPGAPSRAAPLLLEERQVGEGAAAHRPRHPRLLGGPGLPQPREPLARRALLGRLAWSRRNREGSSGASRRS